MSPGRVTFLQRTGAALLCFAALEAGIFRTPLYRSYVEPVSTTGWFEELISDEIRRPVDGSRQILVVGDSRMGLRPRYANELANETRCTFASMSLGGTNARCWYYQVRATDPSARRYAAVVIPSVDYDEPDEWDFPGDHEADLHYVIGRLGLADSYEFAMSYADPAVRWKVLRQSLLKSAVYRQDLLEFVKHPITRLTDVEAHYKNAGGWRYDFKGENKSMVGVQADRENHRLKVPAGVPEDRRQTFENHFFRDHPGTGAMSQFLGHWYGKIVDYYRDSPTRVIFIRLPRGPLTPLPAPAKPHSAVRSLASAPKVILLPEHLCDSLERPELFLDMWHLNDSGETEFSHLLAREVAGAL